MTFLARVSCFPYGGSCFPYGWILSRLQTVQSQTQRIDKLFTPVGIDAKVRQAQQQYNLENVGVAVHIRLPDASTPVDHEGCYKDSELAAVSQFAKALLNKGVQVVLFSNDLKLAKNA